MLLESWANHSTSPSLSIINLASNILANKLYSCKMQRTKPVLKLLENAKLAFSLIDFTAIHSNQNHYSQTLRILSGYRWFDLSSKITKNQALNQAEDFKLLLIFSMPMLISLWSVLRGLRFLRSLVWPLSLLLICVTTSWTSCKVSRFLLLSQFPWGRSQSVLPPPGGELPLPAKYPVPAVNVEFSDSCCMKTSAFK